ncbi:ATP-dependent RNA helicase DOB1 [Nematocida sp. AWRm77]|nr:ATP-dependent RNA helicase DOB1 [Nematocida sp. AWRm77]
MKTSVLLHAETLALSVEEIREEKDVCLDAGIELDSFTETKEGKAVVRHTCIVPEGHAYTGLLETEEEIRCTYPFQLDRFQILALKCLERDESILVSAHTSAGKTLIAEYAIHLSILRKQRVIYTSPIKALSNQKYRELNEKFGDVGLMTGDVTLNPDSTCIVMTTEILRNMIYKGTEILRETHFVVFDEVHYMRDRERGVVWEETIILLPSTTRFIFLSATIPNAEEFARWIVSIHKQPCHVIYTEKRPTPLEHYLYSNDTSSERHGRREIPGGRVSRNTFQRHFRPGAGDLEGASSAESSLCGANKNMHLIVNKEGEFQTRSFQALPKTVAHGYNRRRESINVVDVLKTLQATNNLPAIIFSFRRKECETYALTVKTKFDFTGEREKETIDMIFSNALNSLREEDRKLKQITGLKDMLLRGVGVHHSGLLPIAKEIIEILFQENLLKVLFATETFSIGLNMPARCVVFTSIKKFDGVSTRFVTSGEYIQMSGRAGRRGTDKIGNVVLALESSVQVDAKQIKQILHGPSNPLDSAFRLSYNTILNILRLDGMDEEHVIRHSFLQFRQEMKGKALIREIDPLLSAHRAAKAEMEQFLQKRADKDMFEHYFDMHIQLLCAPKLLFPNGVPKSLLVQNRILEIQRIAERSVEIEDSQISCLDITALPRRELCILLSARKENEGFIEVFVQGGETESIPVSSILRVSNSTLEFKAPLNSNGMVKKQEFFAEFFKTVSEGQERKYFASGTEIPFYCPSDLGMHKEAQKNLALIQSKCLSLHSEWLSSLPSSDKEEVWHALNTRSLILSLEEKIKGLNSQKEQTKLIMLNEYKNKRQILQALGYTANNEVLMKGKVASEISSGDELLLTEMLFNNEFSSLPPGRICSLLSCIVFDEKTDEITLTDQSKEAYKILQATISRVILEFKRLDTTFKDTEYLEKFCPNLMDVVYLWTEGHSFAEICNTTEVFEGSIIRCFRRLEEVLKEMCRASKVIGNVEMENKFSAAISLIKRDIVFANSLYL